MSVIPESCNRQVPAKHTRYTYLSVTEVGSKIHASSIDNANGKWSHTSLLSPNKRLVSNSQFYRLTSVAGITGRFEMRSQIQVLLIVRGRVEDEASVREGLESAGSL